MIKPTFFALTLAVLFAPAAVRAAETESAKPGTAAPGGRRAGAGARVNPAERLKMMKEKLSLTDEQTEKIKAIFQKNREKMTGLKDLPPEERRAKMREVLKAEMEEIAPILTPEQKEKWKEEMKKRREEGGKPGRRPGAAPTKV